MGKKTKENFYYYIIKGEGIIINSKEMTIYDILRVIIVILLLILIKIYYYNDNYGNNFKFLKIILK